MFKGTKGVSWNPTGNELRSSIHTCGLNINIPDARAYSIILCDCVSIERKAQHVTAFISWLTCKRTGLANR